MIKFDLEGDRCVIIKPGIYPEVVFTTHDIAGIEEEPVLSDSMHAALATL